MGSVYPVGLYSYRLWIRKLEYGHYLVQVVQGWTELVRVKQVEYKTGPAHVPLVVLRIASISSGYLVSLCVTRVIHSGIDNLRHNLFVPHFCWNWDTKGHEGWAELNLTIKTSTSQRTTVPRHKGTQTITLESVKKKPKLPNPNYCPKPQGASDFVCLFLFILFIYTGTSDLAYI